MGPWTTGYTSNASGGSLISASAPRAALTVNFTGTYIGVVAKTASSYGKAMASLDGGTPFEIDFYSAATLYQRTVWETIPALAAGQHTLTLWYSGTKNGASTGFSVNVDAFKVYSALTAGPVPTTFQQSDIVGYAGAWAPSVTPFASGGSLVSVATAGGAMKVKFDGTYLAWIAKKGPSSGKAMVVLDGEAPVYVDLYARATTATSRRSTTPACSLTASTPSASTG